MPTLEVPLANPIGSPKPVPADYYYRIPVRPIYKQYPVYAPGREPAGYMDWLKKQDPVILWDDATHKPKLETEADFIKAGELVFSAPIIYTTENDRASSRSRPQPRMVRKEQHAPHPRWHPPLHPLRHPRKRQSRVGLLRLRHVPHPRHARRSRPQRRARQLPLRRASARTAHCPPFPASHPGSILSAMAAPRSHHREKNMSSEQIVALLSNEPPGVIARHRGSLFDPVQVPDLIGVKDRHYLDRTGLQQQHSIVDLMRYAALNQGADAIASFDGFIPADIPNFKKLPDPADPVAVGGRYSDEQLYALALYIYSLKPPPNPNKFDAAAARGKKVFSRRRLHHLPHARPSTPTTSSPPPPGFTIPEDHCAKYDILPHLRRHRSHPSP